MVIAGQVTPGQLFENRAVKLSVPVEAKSRITWMKEPEDRWMADPGGEQKLER